MFGSILMIIIMWSCVWYAQWCTFVTLWGTRWGIGGVGPSPGGLVSRECRWWLGECVRQSEHPPADVHLSRQSRQLLACVGSGLRCTGNLVLSSSPRFFTIISCCAEVTWPFSFHKQDTKLTFLWKRLPKSTAFCIKFLLQKRQWLLATAPFWEFYCLFDDKKSKNSLTKAKIPLVPSRRDVRDVCARLASQHARHQLLVMDDSEISALDSIFWRKKISISNYERFLLPIKDLSDACAQWLVRLAWPVLCQYFSDSYACEPTIQYGRLAKI